MTAVCWEEDYTSKLSSLLQNRQSGPASMQGISGPVRSFLIGLQGDHRGRYNVRIRAQYFTIQVAETGGGNKKKTIHLRALDDKLLI